MEKHNLIDLYTDYILSSHGQITATGLSQMTDNQVSHDQITRMLNSNKLSSKNLWKTVKPFVLNHHSSVEENNGILLVDDTVIPKPYSKENDLNCWHYDHTSSSVIKGINLLSIMYWNPEFSIPVGCELITKPVLFSDLETRQVKRKSLVTKNELFRDLISNAISNKICFQHIIGDCWFGSSGNMDYIDNLGKKYIFAQRSNRLASIEIDGIFQKSQGLKSYDLQEGVVYNALLNGMEKPVGLIKQVFKDGNRVCGTTYLVTNDLSLDFSSLINLYQKRWKIEEYHKSLKSNLGLGKSPAYTVTTQSNHIFLTLMAYIKLETISVKKEINHFALKTSIYINALKASYLQVLKTNKEIGLGKMFA